MRLVPGPVASLRRRDLMHNRHAQLSHGLVEEGQ